MTRMVAKIEQATQDFVDALTTLDGMAAANIGRSEEIRTRIAHLLARLEAGEDLPIVVERESPPLIVQLVTENIEALQEVGLILRKAEANALRAHGYTMERIATIFGVTRQRVSALLKNDRGDQ